MSLAPSWRCLFIPSLLVTHCKPFFDNPITILQGVEYTRSLSTGWKAPLRIRRLSENEAQDIRDRFHIIVEGDHLPPPIIDFAHMKLPPAVRFHYGAHLPHTLKFAS